MAGMLGKTFFRRQVTLPPLTVLVETAYRGISEEELLKELQRQISFLVLNEGKVTLFEKDEWVQANIKEVP